MLSNIRSTLAIALAAAILGASPALAMPAGDDLRGEIAATPQHAVAPPAAGSDLRGENAVGTPDPVIRLADDQRSPDAREPVGGQGVAQPVVVEVPNPDGTGFDWIAAIIGMGAGLALAVLAGVGVAGGRGRPTTV
jgi:hypothetical protein